MSRWILYSLATALGVALGGAVVAAMVLALAGLLQAFGL